MFASATIFCFNIIIIFCFLPSVLGNCAISYQKHLSQRPSFYKYVGSKKLKINTFREGVLKLHDEQNVEVNCNINFEQPTLYKNTNVIFVRCQGKHIFTSTDSHHKRNVKHFRNSSIYIACSYSNWNLYESSQNFHWCPNNVTSYILAKPEISHAKTITYNYLAAVCYDIYNLSFHSVYYSTLATDKINYEQLFGSSFLYKPTLGIKYIDDTFGSNNISENVFDNNQFEYWIAHSNYDFNSIIQHENLYSTFNDRFAPLLEFVWWPNLRLYNWKVYTDALEKHIEDDNKAYNILAGVSNTLKAPIVKSCQKNYTMEEVVLNTNQQIPLYVWNYLQDSDNTTNELVIIGFNSPFYEFYHKDDIVFCPSKCQEISWLRECSSYFHYNIMGTIFCCTVEDVRSSKRLYGFPETDIKPRPVEPVTIIENETKKK